MCHVKWKRKSATLLVSFFPHNVSFFTFALRGFAFFVHWKFDVVARELSIHPFIQLPSHGGEKRMEHIDVIDDATKLAAKSFWDHAAQIPAQMRFTADQLRLADMECRQALEALIDTSCKAQPLSESAAAAAAAGGGVSVSSSIKDEFDPSKAQQQQQQQQHGAAVAYEQQTIYKLENATLTAARHRVEVAQHMLHKVEAVLANMQAEEDEDNEDDDNDGDETDG